MRTLLLLLTLAAIALVDLAPQVTAGHAPTPSLITLACTGLACYLCGRRRHS